MSVPHLLSTCSCYTTQTWPGDHSTPPTSTSNRPEHVVTRHSGVRQSQKRFEHLRSNAHAEFGGDAISGRTGQRIASESAGVVARLENIRLLLAEHRPDRHASTESLKKNKSMGLRNYIKKPHVSVRVLVKPPQLAPVPYQIHESLPTVEGEWATCLSHCASRKTYGINHR